MILMMVVGILMISNIKYSKLNNPKLLLICAILVILAIIPYKIIYLNINIPATIIFIITLIYILYGLLGRLIIKENN